MIRIVKGTVLAHAQIGRLVRDCCCRGRTDGKVSGRCGQRGQDRILVSGEVKEESIVGLMVRRPTIVMVMIERIA